MSLGKRPMMLLIPMVWLAVVLVVAGVTWQVIDSAGRQVLTSAEPPPLSASGTSGQAEVGSPTGDTPKKHQGGPGEGSASPKPSAAASATGQGSPEAGATTPAVPTPTPSPLPTPSDQPGQQTSPAPTNQPDQPDQQPADPPPTQSQVRSWQGAGGTVTAACTGTRISLQSLTPNDGWQYEVGDRGPEQLEVQFKSRGEEEREADVKAACSGGVPRFQVAASDD